MRGLPGEPRLSVLRQPLRASLGQALPQPAVVAEGSGDALKLLQERLAAAGAGCYIYRRQGALEDLLEGVRESLSGVQLPKGLLLGLAALGLVVSLAAGLVYLLPKSPAPQIADAVEVARPVETGLVRLGGATSGASAEGGVSPTRRRAGPGLWDRLNLSAGQGQGMTRDDGIAAPVGAVGPLLLAFGLGLCSAAAASVGRLRARRRWLLVGLPVAAALVLTGAALVRGQQQRQAPQGRFRLVANFLSALPPDGGWFSGQTQPFFGLMEQLRRRRAREHDGAPSSDGGVSDGGAQTGAGEALDGGSEPAAVSAGAGPRLSWRRPSAAPLWPGRSEAALFVAYCLGLAVGTGGAVGLGRRAGVKATPSRPAAGAP